MEANNPRQKPRLIRPLGIAALLAALGTGMALGAFLFSRLRASRSGPADSDETAVSEPIKSSKEHRPSDMVSIGAEAQKDVGITVTTAAARSLVRSLSATGIVREDPSRVAHIRPLARRLIEKIYARLGDRVSAGAPLIEYDNIELWAKIFVSLNDITARKQTENALKRRIDFEKTVASISTKFLVFSEFNNAVFKSLADAGQLSKASRAYLFQFHDSGSIMDNTHEWCYEGVIPRIQYRQNLSSAIYPWLMENLHAGNIIHSADVTKMPPKLPLKRKNLRRRGSKHS